MLDARIVLNDLTQRLREAFPDKVKEVVLHGSHLRGDAREDSDYDFVIVWEGLVDWKIERAISDVATDTSIELQVLVHPLIIGSEELTTRRGQQSIFLDAFAHGLRAA